MSECEQTLREQDEYLSAEFVDSAALARLIEEVRNEGANVSRSYDRTHNRHNR